MIEFIIPTYNRVNHLMTIVCSLMSQSNSNWKIHIVADCPPDDIQDRIKSFVSFINDDRIKLTILPERYNDWGHTPRNYGLENATEEWVVMTGEDNYYTPNMVDEFIYNIDPIVNFVYCDMVHNHIHYAYFNSELRFGKIDIGNFASRTKLAKQIKLNESKMAADGLFVEEYISRFCSDSSSIKKINKALYIHN